MTARRLFQTLLATLVLVVPVLSGCSPSGSSKNVLPRERSVATATGPGVSGKRRQFLLTLPYRTPRVLGNERHNTSSSSSLPPTCKYTAETNVTECVEGAAQSSNCYDNYYPGVPTWSVTGLPAGVDYTYDPNPANSTTCAIIVPKSVAIGAYSVTECASFPASKDYPDGVDDCVSYILKVEKSLYLDVVVNGYVSGPSGTQKTTSSITASNVDKCILTYYCCYAKLNAGPASNNVSDPRSPLQTFIAANCYGGDALTKSSVKFNAYPYTAPASSPQSKTIDAGDCSFVSDIIGGFYCETHHSTALLVTGRSEISRPSATVIDSLGVTDTSELKGELDLNDKIVNYPEVDAASSGYGPGIVPFPKGPFYNCYGGSGTYPPCTKANSTNFKIGLIGYYKKSGWSVPSGVTSSPATYDAHHIEPSAWGGTDSGLNGVFLTNAKNSTNDHQIFSTWWCSFSLPSAPAIPSCAAIE